MIPQKNSVSQGKPPLRTIALAILGLGLIILGGLALILVPRTRTAQLGDEIQEYPPAVPVEVNFPAPELALLDLDGVEVSLGENKGKVILVNNWAFWCPPCRAELPELQAYYDAHRQEKFVIIGIEAGGDKEDVAYFADLFKIEYPVWLDPESKALRLFKNSALPNSYVIDRDGTVRLAWNGPINQKMLEQFVTPLIKEQK